MSASALGLPLIPGARPLLARSARCASNARAAPPRAPDPAGQLDRSRGRPPPSLPGARPLAPGSLHLPAALEGAADRDHVDVLEVAADWDAVRDAGHADAEGLDEPGEVERRRLALGGRVGGRSEERRVGKECR